MVIFVRRCCCNTSIPRIILRIAMLSTQLYWILAQWLRCLEQITWTKEFLEFFFWFAYYFSRCVESWNYSHISYISIMIFSCFHLFIFDLHSKPPWCLNIPVFLSYESARQDTHGTLAWGRALHLGFESLKVEQFASNFHPFFMVRQCKSGPHFTLTWSFFALSYLSNVTHSKGEADSGFALRSFRTSCKSCCTLHFQLFPPIRQLKESLNETLNADGNISKMGQETEQDSSTERKETKHYHTVASLAGWRLQQRTNTILVGIKSIWQLDKHLNEPILWPLWVYSCLWVRHWRVLGRWFFDVFCL